MLIVRYSDGAIPGRRAGSGVGKYCTYYVYNAQNRTGQQKIQLSNKKKHFAHLGMINLYLRHLAPKGWGGIFRPLATFKQCHLLVQSLIL